MVRGVVGEIPVSTNTFTLLFWLLVVGLVSACGSSSDATSPVSSPVDNQQTVESEPPSNDDPVAGNTEETGGDPGTVEVNPDQSDTVESDTVESAVVESDPVESDVVESNPVESNPIESNNGETGESVVQDANNNSSDGSAETSAVEPQNDAGQANTDSQQEPVIADNRQVNFGTAKLLVNLVPNGGSYPAKFHRSGDRLYFSTVDTDPRFANCSYHWHRLGDEDRNIGFNLVATDPVTGAVAMNRQIMTLGDFAEEPNNACAGYNGSIMQVFEQTWITPQSATGEQQLVLHFDSYSLGPDRIWVTDGSEANTSLLATGQVEEKLFIEGDKVFIVGEDGLFVSDTLTGERRTLYEADSTFFFVGVKRIVRSPARQATFEIRVGQNRFQVWTYDLDTGEWEKKFNIKPDSNLYLHHETLMVDGQTLISAGQNVIDSYRSVLGISSNFGDVTSFEILTNSAPAISNSDLSGGNALSDRVNRDQLFYRTRDNSVEPGITSIWRYREQQVENFFSMSEPGLQNMKIIAGYDDRIYVAGTKEFGQGTEYRMSLELWSYDPQTEQLVKLSNDDWSAVIFDHPTLDDGYVFRYVNTPDGLAFVNLTEDSGRELWFTDGTAEGTRQLADINPGNGDSDPRNFYYSGDAIYFSANDGTHDREPWMIEISR